MKTYLDCIPCFFAQAINAAKVAGADVKTQKKIIKRLAFEIQKFPLEATPPAMGRILYGIVSDITGVVDPYSRKKRQSNRLAMGICKKLKNKINGSRDRLLAALEIAIAGNIIDYGANKSLDVGKEVNRILKTEDKMIRKESRAIFDYKEFRAALKNAEKVLYIGDNAGEIAFDRILLAEINKFGRKKKIFYAVKEKPIINDALLEDALMCGIDKEATVISSGVDAPGTILSLCSREFLRVFDTVDMIISKGQGNFEALSDEKKAKKRPIFYLFMAKCKVSAAHIGCDLEDIILFHGVKRRRKF